MKKYEKVLRKNDASIKDIMVFALVDTDIINKVLDDICIRELTFDDIEELKEDLYSLIINEL